MGVGVLSGEGGAMEQTARCASAFRADSKFLSKVSFMEERMPTSANVATLQQNIPSIGPVLIA